MNAPAKGWRVGQRDTPFDVCDSSLLVNWASFASAPTAYSSAFAIVDKQHPVYLISPGGRAFRLVELDAITDASNE